MKLHQSTERRLGLPVAPRRGAWIETAKPKDMIWKICVAPRRGAWIETSSPLILLK